jgi:hypothetical protein
VTICVSVLSAEGLVFAADSVVTLTGILQDDKGNRQVSVIQTFNYANKVTHLKDYPIGVMAWGLASFGDRSIQSLIMEFEYGYPSMAANSQYTVKKVAQDLVDFIKKRYEDYFKTAPEPLPPPEHRILGMLIGGFSSKSFYAEQYQYEFPTSTELREPRPRKPDGTPTFGASWFGMTDALVRLIKGFDLSSLQELINRGVDKVVIQKWIDDQVSDLPLIFDGMPLQDAIDFAEYCVQVTIGRFRFSPGIAACGGDIDIAVMRPSSFTWAKRKQWSIKD